MPQGATSRPATSGTWLVLLMSAAVLINYIDRGNLGTVGPQIMEQLGLTESQFGLLGSAFYATYVAMMAPVGWLSERYGAKPMLAAGVAIWSVATFLTGFAAGFWSLIVLRLLLGIGESVAFPGTSKMVAGQLDIAHTGMANGVIGFGYLVGPAIGTLLGGALLIRYGWRSTFIVFGACSLLWLWPWLRVRVKEPVLARAHDPAAAATPGYGQILRERGLWGASLGHFASNYTFYFILFWLPTYLEQNRGFSVQAMAGITSSAYLVNAVAALLFGWVTDRWVRSGRSVNAIYKSSMALNHGLAIFCMAGMALLPVNASIACLFVYEFVMGMASPGVFGIPQIMAGPTATGRWVGIQNACGNVAGILAPWITGVLTQGSQGSGKYVMAFMLAAVVNVLGLIGWVFVLPKVKRIDWTATAVASRNA